MKILRVEREGAETELRRVKARRRGKVREVVVVLGVVVLSGGVVWWGMRAVVKIEKFQKQRRELAVVPERRYEPVAPVVDEGRAGVSGAMREFAGRLERDLADLGFKVRKIMVPAGKTREMDFYVEGREFFIKTSMGRGTAEMAEDAVRMMKYIEEKGVAVKEYIDVRVAGRGYYK